MSVVSFEQHQTMVASVTSFSEWGEVNRIIWIIGKDTPQLVEGLRKKEKIDYIFTPRQFTAIVLFCLFLLNFLLSVLENF